MSKTVSEWEREKNCIVITPGIDPNQEMTQEEFDAIDPYQKHGVMYDFRVQFLKDNGYAVTRENMVDASLPTRLLRDPVADAQPEQQPPTTPDEPNISVI